MGQIGSAARVLQRSLADFWYQWVVIIVVNTLWLVCCITVVLAAPATFGMYYVTNELANGRGATSSDIFAGLKRYFRVSWGWGILNVIAAVLVWANLNFYGQIEETWSLLILGFTLVLVTLWIAVQLLAPAYIMEQEEKKVLVAMRNALFTLLATPLFSLVFIVIVGTFLAASISIPIILLLGGPCFVTLLCNRAVRDRLLAFGIAQPPSDSPAMDDL